MNFTLILATIKSCVDLWRSKIELEHYTYCYDIETKHSERLTRLRADIARLRESGTVADTDTADQLFLEYKAEQERWEYISAAYFKAKKRGDSTNT